MEGVKKNLKVPMVQLNNKIFKQIGNLLNFFPSETIKHFRKVKNESGPFFWRASKKLKALMPRLKRKIFKKITILFLFFLPPESIEASYES